MNYICIVCELEKPDIVCITETWLCDDITMLEYSISGYHCVRCDRHRHGGGLLCSYLILLCGANDLNNFLFLYTMQEKRLRLGGGIDHSIQNGIIKAPIMTSL